MSDLLLILVLIALGVFREWRHVAAERAWQAEREAMLERLVPGIELRGADPDPLRMPYGDDAREWELEQTRAKALGHGAGD